MNLIKHIVLQVYSRLKNIVLGFISLKLRFSFLLIHSLMTNPFLYVLYLFLFLFVSLFSTAALSSSAPWPQIYNGSLWFYGAIQESALEICFLYWIPELKSVVENLLGSAFVNKTMANLTVKKGAAASTRLPYVYTHFRPSAFVFVFKHL